MIGEVGWNVEEGQIKTRVEVGGNGLAVVLKWEELDYVAQPFAGSSYQNGGGDDEDEDKDSRPCWTFHTLTLMPSSSPTSTPPVYHSSLTLALESAVKTSNRPSAINIAAAKKSTADMAEGEGTTPGAYGAAEDFWDGWSDDGGEEESASRDYRYAEPVQEKREEDFGGGDASYWGSYESVEPMIGGGSSPPAPRPVTPTPPSSNRGSPNGDRGRPISQPSSVTRSRRSSTIRASASTSQPQTTLLESPVTPMAPTPSPPATTTTKQIDFPPLPPSSYLSPIVHPAKVPSSAHWASNHHTTPLELPSTHVPSPLLIPIPAPSKNGHSNGDEVDSKFDDKEDEALHFALAGLWTLYAGKGVGQEREAKMDKWMRLSAMVSRS